MRKDLGRDPGSSPSQADRAVRAVLSVLPLVGLGLLLSLGGSPARAADEIHYTLTGRTSVTFDWRGAEQVIHFGKTSAYDHAVTAQPPSPAPFSSAGPFQQARLTGLEPGTVYHYAIGSGPDATFRTARAANDSNFTVCVEGDIGDSTSYNNMAPVQALIAQQHPELVLMVGDLAYAHAHGLATLDQHFNDVMVWSREAAYMPAWGNAEWDKTGSCSGTSSIDCDINSDCPAGETCASIGDDLRNYKGRLDLPNGHAAPGAPALGCCGDDWYWFDEGNVRFIAYPEPWDGAIADWYPKAAALMDDAQADPSIAFIVTFGHRPAYSSGHHPGETELKSDLDALGVSHGKYRLNLNGHSHDYERTTPQSGVVHVTAGTGGASLEQDGSCLWLTCAQPPWSAYRAMRHGPLVLDFSDTTITGTFICGPPGEGTNDVSCTEGSVLDRFTIVANDGPVVALTQPEDGAAIPTGPAGPAFTWASGHAVYQIQFSASNTPFVPQVFRHRMSGKMSFLPKHGFWRRVEALAPQGQPIYWRVVARGRGRSHHLETISEVYSFTLAP